jgi:hypothetical protein
MSIKFGDFENDTNTQYEEKTDVPDGATVVDADHLDEDVPIRGQEYCLFSFLSPEGVQNCDVRAFKFRGAFSSLDKAQEKARELEKEDKYFKIFIGESGKWLDFDPPTSKVEREMSSNKEQQKILDAQQKQRMNKINKLAGKHKELIDKKDKGEKERTEEIKKMSVANSEIEKRKNQETTQETTQEPLKQETRKESHEETKKSSTMNRLREKLENSKQKKKLEILKKTEDDVKLTSTSSSNVDKNIEEFKKKLMAKKTNN